MKLKTSLIAAATLAVGVISSQAQVYSQNIVGYYNVSIPKNGFALVGNQLDVDGTNGVNQVLGSGLVSDPNGNNNTVLYVWNSSVQQYLILQYWNAADAASSLGGTSAGFYDSGGTLQNPSLKPGSAAFLQNVNNSVSNLTATIVGNVQQLTNITTIIPGFNLVSFNVPVATDIVSSNNYTGVSDPNGNNNDVLFSWNPSIQQYGILYYWNAADAAASLGGTSAGFYDSGGSYHAVTPNVGSGFFIQRVTGATTTWTNTFKVN